MLPFLAAAALGTGAVYAYNNLPPMYPYTHVPKKPSHLALDAAPSQLPTSSKDLRNFWYPIAFSEEISATKVTPFVLMGEPLVLFRGKEDQVICLIDKCPHRSAPLSVGKLFDGNLECLYHGWQFGDKGKCEHIPQAKKGAKTKDYVCAKYRVAHEVANVLWIYAGNPEEANADHIPRYMIRESNSDKHTKFQSCVDADLRWDLVMENFYDIAHIDFTHDGSIGKRSKATPYECKEIPDHYCKTLHPDAFAYLLQAPDHPDYLRKEGGTFIFVPPCHVRIEWKVEGGKSFNQYICVIPRDKSSMRVMWRFFVDVIPPFVSSLPYVQTYLNHSGKKVVYEDLAMLQGLERNLKYGAPLIGTGLSSDEPIRRFRKWMTECEKINYWFQGFAKKSADIEDMAK